MKNVFYLSALFCLFLLGCKDDSPSTEGPGERQTVILEGNITESITLDVNKDYLLKGQVYVKNNSTLTIPEGITIGVEKVDNAASKSALIITKGSKLVVNGTADKPVVFTSAASSKAPGDWIGIIVLGKAPTNLPDAHILGLPASVDTEFGGDVPSDNSGTIRYLRLEYGGGLNPAQEVEWEIDLASGLSLNGVGSGTTVEHVMVKNSLDDGFQFVGGAVNAKYLISLNNGDDSFDFDRGYTGKLQFIIGYRKNLSAHAIRANGMESLNDFDASALVPYTRPVISNMTLIGPEGATDDSQSQGIYIRKNTRFNVRNSIIAGYSNGGLMLCPKTKPLLIENKGSKFHFNLVNSDDPERSFTYDNGPTGTKIEPDPAVATFATQMDAGKIERPSVNKNKIVNTIDGLQLKAVYAGSPDLTPQTGSMALSGADFADEDFDAFFSKVSFVGAVGSENWAASSGWAAY